MFQERCGVYINCAEKPDLPPMNMIIIENIFSSLVFPETFPNPIVVSEELVK